MIDALRAEADALTGADKRLFKARVVEALGPGGQRIAERELRWNRVTVRKGQRELTSGFRCADNFAARGRNRLEKRLPNLLDDIREIAESYSATDSTFRTTRQYTRLTAREVRRRLVEEKGYTNEELPMERTINNKLNGLGFQLRAVTKSRPKKRSPKPMPSSLASAQ
jgi:hypothetical protein